MNRLFCPVLRNTAEILDTIGDNNYAPGSQMLPRAQKFHA
jgi:hypothetical protein